MTSKAQIVPTGPRPPVHEVRVSSGATAAVTVVFDEDLPCPEPALVVRLAGPELVYARCTAPARIFSPATGRQMMAVKCGYDVRSAGTFVVEVLLLKCAAVVAVDEDIALPPCLFNPPRVLHRASHQVDPRPTGLAEHAKAKGRWVSVAGTGVYTDFRTRIQDLGCFNSRWHRTGESCRKHVLDDDKVRKTGREPFYRWSNTAPTPEDAFAHGPICFVGDSHSRGLHVHATRRYGPNRSHYLRADLPYQLLDPDPSGYPGLFASFLDNTALWLYRGGPDPGAKGGFDHIPEATLSCSVMFVSVGQWALSAQTSGKPYSAGRFRREMEQVAARLKAYNVKVGRPVAVLHSLNYSPLGYSRLQCPAADWRTPDRIEAFNAVLQQAALKASLHFVDTTDVIGPIWDSGLDFNHYFGDGCEAQLTEMVARAQQK